MVKRNVRIDVPTDKSRYRVVDLQVRDPSASEQPDTYVECKNYSEPLDLTPVGQFIDILEDLKALGRPHDIVSASGYIPHARGRAESGGLRPLQFFGLTLDGEDQAVYESVHRTVFSMLDIVQLSVPAPAGSTEPFWGHRTPFEYWNEQGEPQFTAWDAVWVGWVTGEIERITGGVLGTHEIRVTIPAGCYVAGDEHPWQIESIGVRVRIRAAAVDFPAQARASATAHARTGELDRLLLTSNMPSDPYGAFPVQMFETDADLQRAVPVAQVQWTVERVPLPRISAGGLLWPMSTSVVQRLAHARAESPDADPREVMGRLAPLERSDLSVFWDEIDAKYAVLANRAKDLLSATIARNRGSAATNVA